jgi:DNA-binding beta-propeller fold protein YncE
MAIQLKPIGTYKTGVFDESAAEIVSYDAATQRLFVVNAQSATIDVLDVSGLKRDGSVNPSLAFSIDATALGGIANSVDVHNGIVAVAVENNDKQAPGNVAFFDTNGNFLNSVTVGALPDMLTFTPDGTKVLVANEGEPNDDYTNDPVGSVSVIDLSGGVANAIVQTAGFEAFTGREAALRAAGVRIFGPGASAAQDFEPEYIAVSADGSRAFVTLQENNAFAVVDVANAAILDVIPLGFNDHSQAGNQLDASNRDDGINFQNYPVFGMYQPDSMDSYTVNGQTYYVTANEGDSRDYDGFSEESRIADLTLDPTAFPNAAALQDDAVLGRLNTTTTLGDDDGDGDYDRLFAYGARSFSIWDSTGSLVFDSGDAIEKLIATQLPDQFNSTNDENGSFDDRSDDKGPEPEALTIGEIDGKPHAFIGLERVGGVVVYDISNPTNPQYVTYATNRDFSLDLADDTAKTNAVGLGPEGFEFIDAIDSPTGRSLLAVASEISGDTTIYEVSDDTDPITNFTFDPNSFKRDKNTQALRRLSDVLESRFDETFYLSTNPDVVGFNGGAIAHFILHGQFEGREPNSRFDSQGYLALNPDVQAAALSGEFTPVSHYIEYGIGEGRIF